MTGNGLIDKIIMGLSLLASVLVISIFFYTNYIYTKPPIDEAAELDKMKADSKSGTITETYKIESIIINLYSETSRLRFLDITPHFVPFKKEHIDLLTKHESIVSDVVISVAGKMSPDELNTVSGKILLESRLKNALNEKLGVQAVKEIFFAKFVVQ